MGPWRPEYIHKEKAFAACSIGMTLGVAAEGCVCVDKGTTGKDLLGNCRAIHSMGMKSERGKQVQRPWGRDSFGV